MSKPNCPECNKEMEQVDSEPDVGINGGYYCEDCGLWLEDDYDYDEGYSP